MVGHILIKILSWGLKIANFSLDGHLDPLFGCLVKRTAKFKTGFFPGQQIHFHLYQKQLVFGAQEDLLSTEGFWIKRFYPAYGKQPRQVSKWIWKPLLRDVDLRAELCLLKMPPAIKVCINLMGRESTFNELRFAGSCISRGGVWQKYIHKWRQTLPRSSTQA